MKEIFAIIISCVFVNNIVLTKFMGMCSFLGVSKEIKGSLGMGAAVTFVMTFTGVITYPIYFYVLIPHDAEYLGTITFILIIAALVQITEMFLRKMIPPLYKSLGIYLPLITTNCAVLGIVLINVNNGYNFGETILSSFATGIAFTMALLLFSGVRQRIEYSDIPAAFKGVPSTLIAASIVALSFIGFSGFLS
ncbi:MAG: RnfABCDGE type electron transport complex subunit A [Oscillospiraceae bacterium]